MVVAFWMNEAEALPGFVTRYACAYQYFQTRLPRCFLFSNLYLLLLGFHLSSLLALRGQASERSDESLTRDAEYTVYCICIEN